MTFIDQRHEKHELQAKCAWCGEVHKTYIMQEKEENKSQGLMTSITCDHTETGIV